MNIKWSQLRQHWPKWRTYSRPERRLFLESLLLLPLAALLLRAARFRQVHSRLRSLTPLSGVRPPQDALATAQRAADMVDAASRYGPYDATCLRRSLVLWWQLRRLGIDAQLRIGVARQGESVAGHAWVEYAGRVLNDRQNIADSFEPLL